MLRNKPLLQVYRIDRSTEYYLHGKKYLFLLAFSIKDSGERTEFREDLKRPAHKGASNGSD